MPRRAQTILARVPATYQNRLRERIDASKIVTKLQNCVQGQEEMSSQQVAAARLLLNKVLPDAVQPTENPNDIKDVKHIPTWKLLESVEGEVIE